MTAQEILHYLYDNDSTKRNKASIISLKGGKTFIARFLKKYQPIRFMDENKWIIYPIDSPMEPVEIDGNEIENLKGDSINAVELAL